MLYLYGGRQQICRYSLADKKLARVSIDWPVEEKDRQIIAYVFCADYSVWLIETVYSEDYSQISRFLCKFDAEGRNILSQEITGELEKEISISGMATDQQGHVYIFTAAEGVWMYGDDGSYAGFSAYGDAKNFQIKGTANGPDGVSYVCLSKGEDPDCSILMEAEFDNKRTSELTADLPADISGFCTGKCVFGTYSSEDPPAQATEGIKGYDFLLYDTIYAYGYDLAEKEKETLFAWGDSNINGYFVKDLCLLEDGRYYAVVDDWESEDRSIVLLTKTKYEDAPRREEITLAAVNGGSGLYGSLYGMAARFNRSSSRYHLSVQNYESLTDLYNAILKKDPIDLIDLSGIDVEKLVRQGVFADLTPFLEASEIFSPSDFLDGILDVYTFNGTLAGSPESFSLRTVVGDGTRLEDGRGLSLYELLAIAGRNPKALPVANVTREEMLQYIMMFNEEAFIDWETGECYFDSERFRAVLEFVNRFPEKVESDPKEGPSLQDRIRNGEILFDVADIYELHDFRRKAKFFEDNAAGIGFPTMDGTGGTLLFANNAFGIMALSEHQSGAWEFIEGVLGRTSAGTMEPEEIYMQYRGGWMFNLPSTKEIFQILAEYAIKEDEDWAARGHQTSILSQEEINAILELVREAKPAFSMEDNEMIRIVEEEAQGYYSGQKSLEDVTGVIQNRAQIYVNENL